MRKSRYEGKRNGLYLHDIMQIIVITVITTAVLFMSQSVAPWALLIPYLNRLESNMVMK